MKQTAVEWLVEQLTVVYPRIEEMKLLTDKAKEMEKQQIIDAFWNGDNTDCSKEQNAKEFAEQYYNKTFKSE